MPSETSPRADRPPTAFQETTQAIVFSAVLVPIWLLCIKPLLASRNVVLAAWQNQQAPSQLPGWAMYMPLLVFGLVYFVAAPLTAMVWAIFIRTRPHIRLAQKLLRASGMAVRYDEGPEVWDEIFGRDDKRGGSVCVKDGLAVEGVLISAGVSPSAKQIHLSGLPDVANSLTLMKADGSVQQDLSRAGVNSVWIDISSEVHRVRSTAQMTTPMRFSKSLPKHRVHCLTPDCPPLDWPPGVGLVSRHGADIPEAASMLRGRSEPGRSPPGARRGDPRRDPGGDGRVRRAGVP